MEPLNHLDSFVQSAEGGSFSVAARRLGLTPAAVSKNVARLEAALGLRLFQRSTRSLTLTEGGERLLRQISAPLQQLQDAMADVAQDDGQPSGTLKVGVALAFGRMYLLPLLAEFVQRYPGIMPDWHFDNRPVDLIGGGFDVAIGGGIDLTPGVIARELAPVHIVATAAPRYMAGRPMPRHPADLAALDGIARRSAGSGRLRNWTLRNAKGEEGVAEHRASAIFDDPEAMAHAAALGMGLALLPSPHATPYLERGELIRLLPGWSARTGPLSIYYSSKKLLPAKTRLFVDFIVERFREPAFARRISGM
ncbi:LysR family transcriptional regulator [Pseudoduganella violacea]|uniref:DNA-binding transcriptional LysR family regulator n=1 Tax=Pseudoduganella violacea TaxID=1715466 RepID=A0A7W5BFA8_9BURK|nr:LysR family transcriptional regulator [Pseudoduganella violacea]MBB3122072.1 DNA-binding transcriptional LysR family regulator [Pseudoduganella violacea]